MTDSPPKPAIAASTKRVHPFRSAVLRGLAIVMPPLLTIVLFIWAWSIIERYVLVPIEGASGYAIVWYNEETLVEPPADLVGTSTVESLGYQARVVAWSCNAAPLPTNRPAHRRVMHAKGIGNGLQGVITRCIGSRHADLGIIKRLTVIVQ